MMIKQLLRRRSSVLLAHRQHRHILSVRLRDHQCTYAAANNPPPAGQKYNGVVISSRRSIHTTPRLSDNGPSPFARLVKSNSTAEENRPDFEASNRRSRDDPNFQEASTQVLNHREDNVSEEEWLDGDDGDHGIIPEFDNNQLDFGVEQFDSELHDWHKNKEGEFHQLSTNTERILESSLGNNESDIEAVLSLIKDWNAFLSSITSDLYSLSDFRRRNRQYPPSDFLTSITYDAAEKAESLLAHLLEKGGASLPPEVEVNAYKVSMEAWSRVFHPQSGDRCETILEQYGERFGGDMNFMPPVDAYKTVLEAHLKSCSSYSPKSEGESSGEKALGLTNLLTSLHTAGDLFLNPDLELYSLTISAVRNTLLDWQARRRFQHDETNSALERELAAGLLGAFEQMESSLEDVLGDNAGKQLSLNQWHCVIRAYADGLAPVSRIPPADDNENTAQYLLTKLEHFISTNAVHSIDKAGLSDTDVKNLSEDIQRNLEESYTSAISSGLILSKERGAFADFNSSLNNAVSSEEIFQRMIQRSQESPPDMGYLFPPPAPEHYLALVESWCECVRKRYSTPESNATIANLEELPHLKAERLIKQLEIEQADQPIDGSIYLKPIWAWSQVLNWPAVYKQQNEYFFAANAIDDLIKTTMERYEKGLVYFSWRGAVTKMYNFAFRLNSKIFKGGNRAMTQSLKLLDQMEHWHRKSEGAIAQPDAFTFGLIMKTISNAGAKSSANHAEAMLKRMERSGVRPNEKHYLGVIRSYSRVGQMDVSEPRKAEVILQHVKELYLKNKSVKPTTAIYSACISAYGGSKKHNSVSKVMELFEELQELYKETGDEDFRPDSMLYGEVIDAISKAASKNGDSIHLAIQLLDKMEKSFDLGEVETGPNRYAYTNLLHSISKSRLPDGAMIAEELMQRLDDRSKLLEDESLRPDAHAYTTLLQIFSQNGHSERAQNWFKIMEQQYQGGDFKSKPNKVTYTALINCWRNSGRAEAGVISEQILSMMERKYKEEGDWGLKPDAYAFAAVIDAWARTKMPNKSVRAWQIYQRMKEQYKNGDMESKPNNVIITTVVKACGYTRGSREDKEMALKVLLECMVELKSAKYLNPTSLTYRLLLNAIKALVADDGKRRPISANIFETCCRKGQVDETVLEALANAQPDLHVKLPPSIPADWKRHVKSYR